MKKSRKDFDLIIFDLDGTLYPVNQEIDAVYPKIAIRFAAQATGKSEMEVQAEFLEKKNKLAGIINGRPTNTLTLIYFYDVDMMEYENAIDRELAVESILSRDDRLIRTLKSVSSHYPLFLFTGNNEKVTTRILGALGIADFFPENRRYTFTDIMRLPISTHEKLDYIKPSLNGFRSVLNLTNVHPGKALMVGDSEVTDILPARQIGIQTYHVSTHESLYRLPMWLGIEQPEAQKSEIYVD
ncbi:MAG: HAD family hydrolase [Candidatus Neomarinimicrobiota bacterium]